MVNRHHTSPANANDQRYVLCLTLSIATSNLKRLYTILACQSLVPLLPKQKIIGRVFEHLFD